MTIRELLSLPPKEAVLTLKTLDSIEGFHIPTKIPLMDYQTVDALFAFLNRKSMNLDDPGMGKTAITLGYLTLLGKALDRPVKALVVTPSATAIQWKNETEKFTDFTAEVSSGAKAGRIKTYKSFQAGCANILIINYNKLSVDFDYLKKLPFDTFVFDEATALKESSTKTHKAAYMLTENAKRTLMLTATPINTNLEEFYNMFRVLHKDNVLPEPFAFARTFLVQRDVPVKGGRFKVKKTMGSKNIELFRSKIDPYFIRRENENSAFKNIKLNIIKAPVPVTKTQAKLISDLRFAAMEDKDSNALTLYSDFIKAAASPSLVDENLPEFSPKAEVLIQLMKKHPGQKYVVFGRYLKVHEIIRRRFDEEGIRYASITGLENTEQKDASKQEFVTDPSCQVMLLTDAGKFGLNLQITNKIIFLDVPYTPADCFQIIGRILRTGQTKDVDAIFLYAQNTLEEMQFGRLAKRQSEIDTFFSMNKSGMFHLPYVNIKNSFMQYADVPPPYFPEPY